MNFCFIIACISGREHLLNDFINAAKKSKYRNCDYYLYYQKIPGQSEPDIFDVSFFKDIHVTNTRDGVCLPRMYWLHMLDNYDFYVIVDDDMEFLGKEDYETAMIFSENIRDCGVISTDCYRTLALYNKMTPKSIFKPKNMQWIDGGMVIKKSIRDLLVKEIDLKPYSYDGFCLITYIHGYTNYYYYGSIVYHKIGRKHGFEYLRRTAGREFLPMFEKWIINPYKENGKLTLPFRESELTQEARDLHHKNAQRMWK